VHRFSRPTVALVTLVWLVLTGCAGPVAQQEFQTYVTSFEQMRGATNSLLDEVGAGERRRGQAVLSARPSSPRPLGVDESFRVADAAFYASNAEPPLTRAYRNALRVIVLYNDTLVGLVEGKTLGELKTNAAELGSEALALAAVVTGMAVAPLIAPALPAIQLLADQAVAAASRAAFKDAFLRNFTAVDALFSKMREGAPDLFDVLARENLARLRQARLDGLSDAARAELIARHEAYRSALSDWVIMIEETQVAMRDVRTVLQAPAGLNASTTDLTERAIKIRVLASTIRTTLSRAR